jgi:hypothetical protein
VASQEPAREEREEEGYKREGGDRQPEPDGAADAQQRGDGRHVQGGAAPVHQGEEREPHGAGDGGILEHSAGGERGVYRGQQEARADHGEQESEKGVPARAREPEARRAIAASPSL